MRSSLLAVALFLVSLPAFAAQGDHPDRPDKPQAGQATPAPTPEIANRISATEGGALYAIQPRRYHPGHEFRIAGGYLPQDAFYKGTTIDVSYGYHFNDFFALELLRGVYSWNHNTDLPYRLRHEFNVEPDPYEKVQYLIASHAQFTPLYGKHALFNHWIIHQELYFLAGGGGVGWVIHENGRSDRPETFRPAADLGFGFRWYASNAVSFKLEGLENFYEKRDGSLDHQIYVTFGVSLSTREGAR